VVKCDRLRKILGQQRGNRREKQELELYLRQDQNKGKGKNARHYREDGRSLSKSTVERQKRRGGGSRAGNAISLAEICTEAEIATLTFEIDWRSI